MQKGNIYELNCWFEGDQTDWCIYIAHDTYNDSDFFGDELRLYLGNIMENTLEQIEQNMVYCSREDLKDALLEVNTEDHWDDDAAHAKVSELLQGLAVVVEEAEEVVLL
jgi:hypothetical protein